MTPDIDLKAGFESATLKSDNEKQPSKTFFPNDVRLRGKSTDDRWSHPAKAKSSIAEIVSGSKTLSKAEAKNESQPTDVTA